MQFFKINRRTNHLGFTSGEIIKAPANYGTANVSARHISFYNVMAQPKAKIPTLVDTILKSVQGKHILLYLADHDAPESFNLAGRVRHSNDYSWWYTTSPGGKPIFGSKQSRPGDRSGCRRHRYQNRNFNVTTPRSSVQ